MALSTVTVVGADAVSARFDGMARRGIYQEPVLSAQARRTAARIGGIPVLTGALESSVRSGAEASPQGFTIRADVPYARHVFHGTRYMEARPPRVPPGLANEMARASLAWVMGA